MSKIAVFDKFPLFSSGIKSILSGVDEFEVIAEAEDINELAIKLNGNTPNVIVVDLLHCNNAGLHLLMKINKRFSEIPVMVITSNEYIDCFNDYISCGVKGFVYNTDGEDDLITSIKRISNGKEFFRKKAWCVLSKKINGKPFKYSERKKHVLTERELALLKQLCEGHTYKEIGAKLFISPRTVETHKKNIMRKTEQDSIAGLVKYAVHHSLL